MPLSDVGGLTLPLSDSRRFPAVKGVSSGRSYGIAINAVIAYDAIMQQSKSPIETTMATLTIRNLDVAVKERLRMRAAEHGHSMEAEARQILQITLKEPERSPPRHLYDRIRARFAPLGGADDLELPARQALRDPPRFD